MLDNLVHSLVGTIIHAQNDVWVWMVDEKGGYLVRSTYKLFSNLFLGKVVY